MREMPCNKALRMTSLAIFGDGGAGTRAGAGVRAGVGAERGTDGAGAGAVAGAKGKGNEVNAAVTVCTGVR